MKMILSAAILMSLVGNVVFADLRTPDQGSLQVTVLDENGKVVDEAPVYIYGERRSHFVGGADVPGATTFTMKEGKYRISSALVRKTGEYIDRFASNEAYVSVVAGDNVSVVLTLKPLPNPEHQALSYASLHVTGIPSGLLGMN